MTYPNPLPPPSPPNPRPPIPVRADTIWGKRPLVEVGRAYSVAGGRYGYEPAVQGFPLGNLNPARRGRGGAA